MPYPSSSAVEPGWSDALPLGAAEAGAAEEVARAVRVARLGDGAALNTLPKL